MLNDDITGIKGIGPKKAQLLKNEAGIESIEDLLYYIPRRYIDRSYFKQIRDCFLNETVTVSGTISDVSISARRKKFLEVEIDDGTDTLTGVFFGGINYFLKIFSVGDFVIFSGKIGFYRKKQIVHPDFDFIDDNSSSSIQSINTGRIIPLYRSTEGLKSMGFDSRGFRRIIKAAIDSHLAQVKETIDDTIRGPKRLMGIQNALLAIHFPESFEQAEEARKRLAFNEIFFHQYYLALSRRNLCETKKKKPIITENTGFKRFLDSLPFVLTKDQKTAIEDIRRDMELPAPMNRLLQGDVGSGKTVVAMAAALIARGRGCQIALMAPTEILAQQHFANFNSFIGEYASIVLLTGSTPRADKLDAYKKINYGTIDLVIGTHAIIQDEVSFKDLGFIVIDEQHRFGVEQRAALRQKGPEADLLVMTATPIPRSLSLTIYGDLAISSIRTMPENRKAVKTLDFTESRLSGVYNSMEKYISQGRQAYYVLPLIEESDSLDLKSAMQAYEHLKNDVFKNRRIDILHGRMKQADRDSVMLKFKKGEIDILVCTTVVEVGIDVPNATIIVIEHAERFGLAQLHQLRGRVGRGSDQSFCILIRPDTVSDESKIRIDTIVTTNDGFVIAEEDLKLRGAGELIGVRQHGHGGAFEFADLTMDMDLILYAREVVVRIVSEIDDITKIWHQFKDRKYGPILNGIRNKTILSLMS